MTDVDRRSRTAYHEAGHALVAVCLDIEIESASLRPGRTFSGVTILAQAEDLGREDAERRIVMTLAGDVGERFVEPLTGRPTAKAERGAVASLKGRAQAAHARLMDAEVADDLVADEVSAMRRSWAIVGYSDWIAQAHVLYLRRWALNVVESHLHALRAVAQGLYSRTVLDGAEMQAIVRGFRCMCHREWGPARASGNPTSKAVSGAA